MALAAAAVGCEPAPVRCPPAAPTPATPTGASSASARPAAPSVPSADVAIALAPDAVPTPHVEVQMTLRGLDGAALRIAGPARLSGEPTASDDGGALPVAVSTQGTAVVLKPSRAPRGSLRLRYAVEGAPPAYPERPRVGVDPDRFEGELGSLVALPDSWDERQLSAQVRIDTTRVGSPEFTRAGSSFGAGAERLVSVRGRDLRGAIAVAGLMGSGVFAAPEGNDEAVWMGYTAFDPRPAVADLAAFRTAARQIFNDLKAPPLAMLLLADARPVGAFAASRRGDAITLRLASGEPWSGAVRIAMATEIVHEWIGGRLWVGPHDATHEAQAYWFSEGVARALARDLLFRFGLLTPAELAAEVEGLTAVAVTSPLAAQSNDALAAMPAGALPLLVARGALYATRVDALLRAKSKGKRALANVLRELYDKAAAARGPLPVEAWLDAVAKDLGDAERAAFRDRIERGGAPELPDGALGPCFTKARKTYAAFDAGLDVDVTRRSGRATGVAARGPAAAAGLREGDRVLELRLVPGRSDVPVEAVVEGQAGAGSQGGPRPLRWLPAGARSPGVGWDRRRDIADDACTK